MGNGESRDLNSTTGDEARRKTAAHRLEQYIAGVVATAPPLTVEAHDRLAGLLRAAVSPDARRPSCSS